jgi:uncharacterized protein YjbI with pentapeptide repeats
MGEMALVAGEYYTDKNHTKVIQGALTPEQKKWLEKNHNPLIDAITYLPLTPAQKLYLALCKNGMQLQEALESCGLTDDQKVEAQQALRIFDNDRKPLVNTDGIATEVTRPSFFGTDLNGYDLQGAHLYGADLRHADLREANLQGADLWEADLEFANLQGADLYGADLRHADLREAYLKGAQMQGAWLWHADLQGADLDGADLRLTDLSGAYFEHAKNLKSTKWDLAFYDATDPPKNLPDNITDKLLALDEPAYKTAKELQAVYREALVSDNETAITAAENALTEHLGKCREENAKNALKKTLQKTVPVLGAEAIPILVKKLAGSAVRVTDGLPTTAASLSDVSLGGNYSLPEQAKAPIKVSNPPSPDNPYNYYRSR